MIWRLKAWKTIIANNAEAMLWRASALLNEGESDEGMEVYQANADTALNYPYEIRLAVVAPIIQNMLNVTVGRCA